MGRDSTCTITGSNYQREYNVNMSDAIFRAITGEFGTPGELGFMPHDEDLDLRLILFALQDAAVQIVDLLNTTDKVKQQLFSMSPNLKDWYLIPDADIREAIEACSDKGIAAVHSDWGKFDFYNIPSL